MWRIVFHPTELTPDPSYKVINFLHPDTNNAVKNLYTEFKNTKKHEIIKIIRLLDYPSFPIMKSRLAINSYTLVHQMIILNIYQS